MNELERAITDMLERKELMERVEANLRFIKELHEQDKARVLGFEWDKTIEQDGARLTRVVTKKVTVTDPKSVITWLKRNKYKVEDFTTLDRVKTKPVLSTAIFTQGKKIQGACGEQVESLRVSV